MKFLDRRDFFKVGGGMAGGALLTQLFPFRKAFAQQAGAIAAKAPDTRFTELAGQYDFMPGTVYLNHAAIGAMPRIVREALCNYIYTCETHPSLHIWGDVWKEAYSAVRDRAAKHWGCESEEIAMTHNTTESFNILAAGLELKKRDQILYSNLNHAGARVCWEHYGESRGYSVKEFDFPVERTPELTDDELIDIHLKEVTGRTRVLVLPHIDNFVGVRLPIKELAKQARKKGVEYIAVDGAQTAGMIPLDMRDYGVDFYATSPHKWMQSSKERGLMWVPKDLQDKVRPLWVTWGKRMWSYDSRKYEDFGTRNLPSMLALDDALKFQESLGEKEKEAYLKELWTHAYERVANDDRLIWRSPKSWEMGGSLYAVEVKDHNSSDVADTLEEKFGVVVRPFNKEGLSTLRISPNVMNTKAELDLLFDGIAKEFKS